MLPNVAAKQPQEFTMHAFELTLWCFPFECSFNTKVEISEATFNPYWTRIAQAAFSLRRRSVLAESAEQPSTELVNFEGRTSSFITEAFAHAFISVANGLHDALFFVMAAYTAC